MGPSRRGRGRGRGGRTAAGRSGSRTIVITGTSTNASSEVGPSAGGASSSSAAPVLKLRRRRRVRWSAETHDNEHDGKKSSKSCCVFHKSRAWDESSSESGGDDLGEDCRDGNDRERDVEPHQGDGGNESSSSGGPVRERPRHGRPLPKVEGDDDGFFD